MQFVLVDESTLATAGSMFGGPLTPAILTSVAAALTIYMNRDLGTVWGGAYRVRAGSGPTDVQPGEIVCAIQDALPTAPGAVAYHDVEGAEVPVIFLARSQCNSISTGPDSISGALSHELAETAGDPAVNKWVDDGQGHEWCHELCDAVQEWGYEVSGIAVSDFVLPAFFAPGAIGPYSFCGLTAGGPQLGSALSTAPGGYQMQRVSGTGETQVTGEIGAHRMARKRSPTSRSYRRGWRGAMAQ
jgi:hypothetical protein